MADDVQAGTRTIKVPHAAVDKHRRDAARAAGFRIIVTPELLRELNRRPGEPTR